MHYDNNASWDVFLVYEVIKEDINNANNFS